MKKAAIIAAKVVAYTYLIVAAFFTLVIGALYHKPTIFVWFRDAVLWPVHLFVTWN